MAISIPQLGNPEGISAYANARTTDAANYIVRLSQLAGSLQAPLINPVFPTTPSAPPLTVPSPPTLQTVVWNAPALPAPFTGTLDIGDYLPEMFDEDAPTLNFGSAPAPFSEVAPDAPGVSFDFEEPELQVSLPAPPALLSLNIETFNGLNLPTFNEQIPELTAVAPTPSVYTPGSLYTSELLEAVQTELHRRITEGGTGLSADVEQAIWDRGREREARANADALRELEKMESMGFAMPPGVYLDARLKLSTETAYVAAGTSREIMIKQAELEQENVKAAFTQAIQLEGNMIQYRNQVEQRLFESLKYATEAGISIYNAKVQAYSAYVDAYKTKVAIYEAQIRGELARVDAYKAQIAAEQSKAEINRALVDQYKVQADVALSAIEIFKAKVAAIQSRAEIEKLKVAIFGEQIRGYTAKVNAYTAGVEGFRATISAEAAKQEAFKSQVQAYTARVEAAAKVAEARIEEFKGLIAAKNSEYEGYKSIAAAETAKVQGVAALNNAAADSYRATVSGLSSYNEVLTKQWQVSIDQAQRIVEIGIAAAKANGELFMTTRSLSLDAAKVGAQVSAQLGSAAINAINWSTSYSVSNSFGQSVSTSTSNSESSSKSRNENYNYSA